MNFPIESTSELESIIEDAIKSKVKKLDLNFDTKEYIIPESIGNISDLEELAIFNESLCPIYIKEVPETIGRLSNLKKLKIYDCSLEYLPESIGNIENLQELDLADLRNLKALPNSIGKLKHLLKLEIKGRKFSFSHLDKLPDSIGELTYLKYLVICNTAIHYLPDTFGNLSNLEYLEIQLIYTIYRY
ncbi:MAG: hypothetical protein AAFW70_21750 [Cyanobacteria bacterium J06635_10]